MVGSKDMSTWVFGAERWANLIYYSLGGHKDVIVGCFFEKDSLDVSLSLAAASLGLRTNRIGENLRTAPSLRGLFLSLSCTR